MTFKPNALGELHAICCMPDERERLAWLVQWTARWVEDIEVTFPLGSFRAGEQEARERASQAMAEQVFRRVSMRAQDHFVGSTLSAKISIMRSEPYSNVSPARQKEIVDSVEKKASETSFVASGRLIDLD